MNKITTKDISNIIRNVLLESFILNEKTTNNNTAVKNIRKYNKQLYKSKTLFEYIYNVIRDIQIGDKINLQLYNRVDDAIKSSIIRYMSVFCTLDICQGNIIDGYYKIGKNKNEKMMPYEYAKNYINAHDSTIGKFNVNKDDVRAKICTNSMKKIKKAEDAIEKAKAEKIKNK